MWKYATVYVYANKLQDGFQFWTLERTVKVEGFVLTGSCDQFSVSFFVLLKQKVPLITHRINTSILTVPLTSSTQAHMISIKKSTLHFIL